MFDTEKTYLEFIQTIVILFLNPVMKSIQKDKQPLLKDLQDIQLVFQNIVEIQEIHSVSFSFFLSF